MTVRAIIPTGYTATQSDIDTGLLNNKRGEVVVVDANGVDTGKRYNARGGNATPVELVDAGNINTVLASAGGAGWEKTQITTAAYQLKPATSGASRDFHIEAGGSLAALVVADWPIPASPRMDVFKIRNFSGGAVVFTVTVGAGQFSGIVTADDDPATPAATSYSIRNDGMAVVSIDSNGWVQVVPSAEVSQAEHETLVATVVSHGLNTSNPHSTTKSHVGLGSVDNTADSAKPVSSAQQTALDAKQATLVAGTNIKTVNNASVLGAGNMTVAADLPGGTATTALDDGLDAGNAVIDRATVPGQTILRYATTGTSTFKVPVGVTEAQVLVVAGGGGGGVGIGGGGGGGGLIASSSVPVSGSVTVTVGTGGPGRASDGAGTKGSNSVFGSITAEGGGGGGGWTAAGQDGGSGGGGNSGNATYTAAGTGTQGNNGGAGEATIPNGVVGGGGGGAGGVGAAGGTATTNGLGGVGVSNDITGTATFYGGGGGAGLYMTGATTGPRLGGNGGGGAGNGISTASVAGTANTGGGGGGNQGSSSAAGGSGVVIVRFATQSRSYKALSSYADDTAAKAASLLVGQFYKDSITGAVRQVA